MTTKARPVDARARDVRHRIVERSQELSVGLAEMSRALGRNTTYMHQFITRGSPTYLADDGCVIVAGMLGLSAQDLMAPRSFLRSAGRAVSAATVPSMPAGELPPGDVPTFRQTDEIAFEHASHHSPRTLSSQNQLVAVRMDVARGRLEPGDLVYLARQPARIGDTVFLLREHRILGWGRLREASARVTEIESDGKPVRIDAAETEILRVVAIVTVY